MTGNVRFLFTRWLFFYTYAMMKKGGIAMTREKIRKKFQLWLTLTWVFLILTMLLSRLQDGSLSNICLGVSAVCLVMTIAVLVRHGRCRVCGHPLDKRTILHGGYCRFCGAAVEDEEE